MILTARETRGVTSGEQYRRFLMGYAASALLSLGLQAEAVGLDFDETAPPVPAEINHGTWKAACPSLGCQGAIDLLDGWGFLCPYCLNGGSGLLWRVAWPEERGAIEALLEARRVPSTRNWRPGESLARLAAENERLGVG